MIKELLNQKIFKCILGVIVFLSVNLFGQFEGSEGQEWLNSLKQAIDREQIEINVEEIDFENKSFFDIYVNSILRASVPEGMEIPGIGTNLSSQEVTDIIMAMGPELIQALPNIDMGNDSVQLDPGAAVKKWDPEGRWSKGPHKLDIENWVQVNQWIRAASNTSKFSWGIFAPGTYSTDCMLLSVNSNADVMIDIENYGPLKGPDGAISTSYALSKYTETEPGQVFTGKTMNGAEPLSNWIEDGQRSVNEVGKGGLIKVWNSIDINGDLSPGLYTTPEGRSATITIIALDYL